MSIVFAEKAKIGVDVFGDIVSAPRNILNAATKGASVALPILLALQGILTFLAGVYTTIASISAIRSARKAEDCAGVTLNAIGAITGLSQTTLGAAATVTGIALSAGKSVLAAKAAVLIPPGLFAVYGLFLTKSAFMLKYVSHYQRALAKEDTELQAFLLKENPAQIQRILGEEAAASIHKMRDGEAINMIYLRSLIQRECLKQRITHILVISICLIGISATLASILLSASCPLAAPILYAIGSTLWIFIDFVPLHLKLRDWIAEKKLGSLSRVVQEPQS